MPRVEPADVDEVGEGLGRAFAALSARDGLVRNIYRVMGRSPAVLEAFLAMESALGGSRLEPKLRELAFLAVSEANNCRYGRHLHHGPARRAGLTERHVQSLDEDIESSDSYDEIQKDVIRLALAASRNARVEAGVVERLRKMLSDQDLVELAMVVAFANGADRFVEILDVDLP